MTEMTASWLAIAISLAAIVVSVNTIRLTCKTDKLNRETAAMLARLRNDLNEGNPK